MWRSDGASSELLREPLPFLGTSDSRGRRYPRGMRRAAQPARGRPRGQAAIGRFVGRQPNICTSPFGTHAIVRLCARRYRAAVDVDEWGRRGSSGAPGKTSPSSSNRSLKVKP